MSILHSCDVVSNLEMWNENLIVLVALKNVFVIRDPGPILIPKGWGSPNDQIEQPSSLSQEDIDYFASTYKKTGFTGPVNYYQNVDS